VEGDLHDRRFDRYRRTTSLTGTGIFSSSSASYTLTLYPNEDLFQVYSTNNPRVATMGAVCIIIFTSILFILYDFFVRQEFNEKRSVLEAKRKFVKFVSHEVRTPLNAVCMGLRLMEEELRARTWPDSSHSTEEETASKIVPTDSENKGEILVLAEEILSNANSAVDVLNDLLNYDKVEMGTLSLELTIIPIWDLIERTMKEFNSPAKAKKIDFKLDYSALFEMDEESASAIHLPQDVTASKVLGDTIRITQVLRNLVSNAVKFTPEGGKGFCFGFCLCMRVRAHPVFLILTPLLCFPGSVTVRASYARPPVRHKDQGRNVDNFTFLVYWRPRAL
jgi:signal transduction histidine kinase